ncbi:DUF350 domain-containing protein [Desmospora activa]|uniref:Putative membrane protein n=1 Tax=Desmospora activa DSM 45169 TaxID=1121389 RepID=A0A2T4Z487_9BACL|nr:DUF350 domain-containing protein [Desmospora activa]PTM56675.1 putative membrane protein [Desmospora activa DSM 45169]
MLEQWPYLLTFLIYLGVSIPILLLGIFIFQLVTPYKEHLLIKEGAETDDPQKMAAAKAAAYDLGGKLLGLTLVLSSAVYHSIDVVDLLIWGVIGIIFQVLVFYLFELITPFKVVAEIPKGNIAVGTFAAFLSIATGLLLASLISY